MKVSGRMKVTEAWDLEPLDSGNPLVREMVEGWIASVFESEENIVVIEDNGDVVFDFCDEADGGLKVQTSVQELVAFFIFELAGDDGKIGNGDEELALGLAKVLREQAEAIEKACAP